MGYTSSWTIFHQHFFYSMISCYKRTQDSLPYKTIIEIRVVVISAQEKVDGDQEIISTVYSHGAFGHMLSHSCIKY